MALRWTLEPGEGVYTSEDIKNAIRHEYVIEFLPKALIWNSSAPVYSKYVTMFYKMKSDCEKSGNDVGRNVAKLLLNALYGKSLQKAITSNTSIINSISDYIKFCDSYVVTDYIVMHERILLEIVNLVLLSLIN